MAEATGIAFLAIAIGGAWYISNHTPKPSVMATTQKKKGNPVSARASNASEMAVDNETVMEAAAPTLQGKWGGGRLIERVTSTRLANSWRNSEMPNMTNQRTNHSLGADEMLVRIRTATKHVLEDTLHKTAYIYDPDRQRPVIQGKIRSVFQTSNFLK